MKTFHCSCKNKIGNLGGDSTEILEEIKKLKHENRWFRHLLETIRDKAELKFNKNDGYLAFSDLKDEALKTF